jgi:L-fuculose-phosphate aldolase
MSMNDITAAQRAVLGIALKLANARLTVGTYGNVSARVRDCFVITPSGADRHQLRPEDISVVDFATGKWTGPKPSAERALHLALYRTRSDVGSVIHAHAPDACTVAAAQRELPAMTTELAQVIGPSVRVAKHAITGTKKLERETLKAIAGRQAALLANHGAVCVGRDLDDAFHCLEVLERGCRAFIESEFARTAKYVGSDPANAMREYYLHCCATR